MATVKYTIISGVAPFIAELRPSSIPINTHTSIGMYEFIDVPNGSYELRIVDSNGCEFIREITVDPFVTTTTTTIQNNDSIILGNSQDENLIFNVNSTNRDNHYSGYPDENVVNLYLWLKTTDGAPLTERKALNYSINGNVGNTFSFVELSDQIHSEVIETTTGFARSINGQLILKEGFIETFFQYVYRKNPTDSNYEINLGSNINWLNTDIPLVDGSNQYGITYVDNDNIIMKF